MEDSKENNILSEVWPPPISPGKSGQSERTIQSILSKRKCFYAVLKEYALGLGIGVLAGPAISLLALVIHIAFARYGYNLPPYIYYGAPFVELIAASLIFVRRKSMALGFASGAILLSVLITLILTFIDGTNGLD